MLLWRRGASAPLPAAVRVAGVALAAVPTMIAGIYGMNFADMPELNWQWGYPTVLTLMATVCGFMYYKFRRNHWL